MDFTFDLINAGNQTATASYDIRTYISLDNQLSVDDIREGNIVTGGTPPGTTPNVNGAFTVPDNLFPGDYFLILKVDDGNTVTETNENNNVFSTPITIFDDGIGECNNPVLVSQGKPATQSSTLNFGGINSGASNAVDGNTDGNYYNGSVAATTEENQAWWQVDLGGFYDVFSISAYNRTEGTARLNDFYIMASDTPFSSVNLVNARNNASYEIYIPGQANVPTQWFPNNNAPVRYVRVQRTGNGYLTLAELQVNGCPVANLQGSSAENSEATEELTTPYLNVGDLYPNPTSREVFSQIESAFAGEIFVQVVNILGQVNLEQKVQLEVGMNTLQLELEHCKAGIYHVIFHSKTKLISKQIVLSKL